VKVDAPLDSNLPACAMHGVTQKPVFEKIFEKTGS
jgi:hypothetical protein